MPGFVQAPRRARPTPPPPTTRDDYRAIYVRYKRNQKILEDWLVKKATGRTTGRKNTRLLVGHARTIAQASKGDPGFLIPRRKINAGEAAIHGRQVHVEWHDDDYQRILFEQINTPESIANIKRSNDNHVRELENLERIMRELKTGNLEPEPVPSTAAAPTAAPFIATNPFASSSSAMPGELQGGNDIEEDVDSAQPSAINEDDPGQDTTDIFFFLREADAHREEIRKSWQRYVQGDLSLPIVTRMTEEAIRLIQISGRDIATLHLSLETLEDLNALLGNDGPASSTGPPSATIWPTLPEQAGMPRIPASVKLLCGPAFCTLHWVRNTLVLATKGVRDVNTGFHTIAPYPAHGFARALIAVCGDLADMVNRNREQSYAFADNLDIYTASLLEIAKSYEFHMWDVYATQIHMDIWDILQADMGRGYCEGMEAVWFRDREIRDYQAQYYDSATAADHMQTQNVTREVVESTISINKREVDKRGWLVSGSGPECQPISIPRIFLSQDLMRLLPLLPLHQARRMLVVKQSWAAEIHNRHFNLLACMRLYQAVQLSQTTYGQTWNDMDFFLRSQARDSPFRNAVTQGPGSLADLPFKFTADLGLHVQRQDSAQARPPMPTMPMTSEQQCKAVNKLEISAAANSRPSNRFDHFNGILKWHRAGNTLRKTNQNQDLIDNWNTRTMSTKQLLQLLEHIFVEDEVHLRFPHINFALDCIEYMDERLRLVGMPGLDAQRIQAERNLPRTTPATDAELLLYDQVYNLLWATTRPEGAAAMATLGQTFFTASDGRVVQAELRSSYTLDERNKPAFAYWDSAAGPVGLIGTPDIDAFLDAVKLQVGRSVDQRERSIPFEQLQANFSFFQQWRPDPDINDGDGYEVMVRDLRKCR